MVLHLLVGKPFPDLNEFCIHLLYRGIARQKSLENGRFRFLWFLFRVLRFAQLHAFKHMCEMLPAPEHSPAFVFPKGSGVVPVTNNVYNRYIKYF